MHESAISLELFHDFMPSFSLEHFRVPCAHGECLYVENYTSPRGSTLKRILNSSGGKGWACRMSTLLFWYSG